MVSKIVALEMKERNISFKRPSYGYKYVIIVGTKKVVLRKAGQEREQAGFTGKYREKSIRIISG